MENLSLEERVARLEGRLGWGELKVGDLTTKEYFFSLVFLSVAVFVAYLGMGVPNSYYQVVFAIITLFLLYQREWLHFPKIWYEYILVILNVAVLSILYKIVIGVGKLQPLAWVKYPVISGKPPAKKSWVDVFPGIDLSWQTTPVSEWIINITVLQTFIFLLALLGALIGFQPFASFMALFLIIISLPALATFNWTFVFPALMLGLIGIFLQRTRN